MTRVARFTFNSFQENTYVLYDDSGSCIIIDPGCQTREEEQALTHFIQSKNLTPVRLILTHCHIDHVLGNQFVYQQYGLKPECHKDELIVLEYCGQVSKMYGIPYTPSPTPDAFLPASGVLEFGNSQLEILFTPGHSPASLSFYSAADKFIIAGDVLFQGSIGRTDLPGGNFETLVQSIQTKYYVLDDQVVVYPGHGPETSIGYEKRTNPFVKIA